MTSIREMIRRLLGGDEAAERKASSPRPDYSYRVYWTKMARSWSPERRRAVREAVRARVEGDEFEANAFERRYRVEALGDGVHAGASLLALLEVIDALQTYEDREQEEREP